MILHISSSFGMSYVCAFSAQYFTSTHFRIHSSPIIQLHILYRTRWKWDRRNGRSICIPLAVAPTVYAGHVRDPIGNRLHCYTDEIIHLVRAFCFDKIFAFAPVCICCTSFTKWSVSAKHTRSIRLGTRLGLPVMLFFHIIQILKVPAI